MKFIRFLHRQEARIGILDSDQESIALLPPSFTDMNDVIGGYEEAKVAAERATKLAFADVQLLAPLAALRRNIFCVGKNYREHAREFARSGFEAGAIADVDPFPAVFTKPPSAIVGPGAVVDLHAAATSAVDYEGELAVVIGKSGRNIAKEAAYDHVWGYLILNDVTARDRQKNHKQWFLGKALDTFCPLGPWVATAEELDPANLDIQTWVNGELRQSANTGDLIFDIPTLIEAISAGLMLQPGDVISTGTPAGVGIGFTPPKFLRPGDVVSISITGLGTLTNTFA